MFRRLRLGELWRLRKSYWFVPSALTVLALALGYVLPWVDEAVGRGWMEGVSTVTPMSVEGARALLSMLAGSIIGVAGVAFSITMVAVSFASANYGPRLIGNFMGDRTNQVVLGVFVATFVYCTAVLASVHSTPQVEGTIVPQISIIVAIGLALASVAALIVYIHHIPESIDVMNLTANIGGQLRRSVVAMLDEEAERTTRRTAVVDVAPASPPKGAETVLGADAAGYIQRIDIRAVHKSASRHGLQVTVVAAPGDFVAAGQPILRIRGSAGAAAGGLRDLASAISVGSARTDVQDVLFLSDHLVEVLGRALSPGINDPHTAIICLDWLRAGMTEFARRPGPPPPAADEPVIYTRVSFEEMADRSFGRMRQYVAKDRTATLHMLAVLSDLAEAACHERRAALLTGHMRTLAASASESLAEEAARAEVSERLGHLLHRVGEPGLRGRVNGLGIPGGQRT